MSSPWHGSERTEAEVKIKVEDKVEVKREAEEEAEAERLLLIVYFSPQASTFSDEQG